MNKANTYDTYATEYTNHYQVADLSTPLPNQEESFDLIISNMVLMDVYDYQGFVSTLSKLLKANGRAIFTMHNPYNSVRHERVANYFDSGHQKIYEGFKNATGVSVIYHHRTLEEYIATFRNNGFLLRSLSDLAPTPQMLAESETEVRERFLLPLIMLLEFVKSAEN